MFKALKFLIWLVYTLIWLTNCEAQTNSNALTNFYYPNGQISSQGKLVNNKPIGLWISYYVDGTIKSEGVRKNGFLDSVWVFYNRKGLIAEKISYLDGKKNGYYYYYNYYETEGSVIIKYLEKEELYVNNIKNGVSNYYWQNGNYHWSILYDSGVKNGITKEFNELGELIGIIEYRKGIEIDYEAINRLKNGLKVGVWKEFYPNGKVKLESNYWDGVLSGLVKTYDLNGDLIIAQRFENDLLIDSLVDVSNNILIQEEFYDIKDEFGEPLKKSSGGYVDGIPVGVHRTYDSLGRVNTSKLYNRDGFLIGDGIVNQEGDKVGIWKFYYVTGKLKSTGTYYKNRRVGLWQYFYKNGSLEQEGNFKKGRPHDLWKWYFISGELKREEYYNLGREEGLSIEFDIAGNILAEGNYMGGLKTGTWFYDYVTHNEKGKYNEGNKVGTWYYFYKNGNIYFEGSFLMGLENGKHLYYYSNGKLKQKRNYLSGIRIKNWEYYDYYGSLIKVLTFENDKLIKIDGTSVLIK